MKTTASIILMCCFSSASQQSINAAETTGYVIEWGWDTSTGNAARAETVLDNVKAVCVGRWHCLALKGDATVVQWAADFRGQKSFENNTLTSGEVTCIDDRGHTNIILKQTTTIVTNGVVRAGGHVLSNFVAVAAGNDFSTGLRKDGTIISWGNNSTKDCPSNVVAIAAAAFTTLAVRIDGTVLAWMNPMPSSEYGLQMNLGGFTNIAAVAIGKTYSGTRELALTKDGTVTQWGGQSTDYPPTPPVGLRDIVAVAAGANHNLAVKRDGTIVGWGGNDVGQATGIPTSKFPHYSSGIVTLDGQILSNVVSVAANDNYSMALRRDGTIVAWGKMVNNQYPATVPEGLSNVVSIAAGDYLCLAITTNKAVADRFQRK
jgi:alpha-tubulin suppressor-like RCC1 family protein